MARLAANVLTIEKHASLAELAAGNLDRTGIQNVEVVTANGLVENPRWAHVGFDVVVVSGAVERVPEVLIDRLNPGGRLAAIVGTAPVMQAILMERVGSGLAASVSGMRTSVLFDTLTKPMEDAPRVSKFTF